MSWVASDAQANHYFISSGLHPVRVFEPLRLDSGNEKTGKVADAGGRSETLPVLPRSRAVLLYRAARNHLGTVGE